MLYVSPLACPAVGMEGGGRGRCPARHPGRPLGRRVVCGQDRGIPAHPGPAAPSTAAAEEPTKRCQRRQLTCLQGPSRITNEPLPIGLSQAKFPGTCRPTRCQRPIRVPIGAAYVFCGISFILHRPTRQLPLGSDWLGHRRCSPERRRKGVSPPANPSPGRAQDPSTPSGPVGERPLGGAVTRSGHLPCPSCASDKPRIGTSRRSTLQPGAHAGKHCFPI